MLYSKELVACFRLDGSLVKRKVNLQTMQLLSTRRSGSVRAGFRMLAGILLFSGWLQGVYLPKKRTETLEGLTPSNEQRGLPEVTRRRFRVGVVCVHACVNSVYMCLDAKVLKLSIEGLELAN